MKHIIIGTAGHIDHGKTTLIHALTGRNTDRLKEEQKRGITIELGFTWFDLKDHTRCGIIDVPGHEKFINNMVAGVVGMDLVLMVVAADEGIMPQTKEHLDILGLLGIEKTILVLNKCDTVDEEWLGMMEEDVKEELKGTIMEGAPVAKVSAMTGEGIAELKELILKMVKDDVPEKDVNSIPRLPVDRVFSMPGFGTVVTGTLISGSISKNDVLEVFPVGKECKIRTIQVHETNQEKCEAGQRVALNLSNIHKDEIHRGCVIAPIGSMENSRLMDVKLTVLKDSKRNIKNRDRLHLFTGTSEILCRAILLDKDELEPGDTGLAELLLEEELATKRGDRFIVRFYSPLETIGGGVILEPNPRKKKRFNEEAIEELLKKESGSLADVCELNIRAETEDLITLKDLAKNMSHSAEELRPYLDELREALRRSHAKAPRRSQTDSDKPDACDLNLKPDLKLDGSEFADDSTETYTYKNASLSSKDNTIIIDYDRAPLIITDHLYCDYVKYQFPAMCCVFLIFLFFAVIVVGPPELGVLQMFILVPLPLIEAARREGEAYFVMTNSAVAYYKKGEIVKFFELAR